MSIPTASFTSANFDNANNDSGRAEGEAVSLLPDPQETYHSNVQNERVHEERRNTIFGLSTLGILGGIVAGITLVALGIVSGILPAVAAITACVMAGFIIAALVAWVGAQLLRAGGAHEQTVVDVEKFAEVTFAIGAWIFYAGFKIIECLA